MSIIYLSQEGYDQLKKELNTLKSIDRPRVINQISEARDKGDLSENAEYDAAKEAQGLLEARIAKLENELSNVRVLDKSLETCLFLPTVCIGKKANINNKIDSNCILNLKKLLFSFTLIFLYKYTKKPIVIIFLTKACKGDIGINSPKQPQFSLSPKNIE